MPETRHFVGVPVGPSDGWSLKGEKSMPTDFQEAAEWGKKHLSHHPGTSKVIVYEAVAVIERTAPPVEIRHLKNIQILNQSAK